ncbi:hypothetical protein OXX79_005354 [Metschnikowia pulcherrima]
MPLSVSSLEQWSTTMASDTNTQLGASVLANFNADEALIDRAVVIKNSTKIFNTRVKAEGLPITNQRASGRCWLFAAGNVLRLPLMAKLNLKEFQFSQSYWFFMISLRNVTSFWNNLLVISILLVPRDLTRGSICFCSRTRHVMEVNFINVVEKYGMVPHELFPDAYSATASRTLNFMLKTKLREFAETLREKKQMAESMQETLLEMQQEIHRLMVMFLGQPPHPEQRLSWDYKDKDEVVKALEFTPMSMYKEVLGADLTGWVSLLNDPRNPYERVVKIDKLGNVAGSKEVSYLNINIEDLAKYAVERIQSNNAVFFGTHTPIYMDKKRGIMDQKLFNYSLIGFNTHQSKASRIEYQQSLMTHAMVLTAVHLDKTGQPVRWRVENSWGKDSGQEGYYVMDHQYFKDYVYQIVTEKVALSAEHQQALKSEPVTLPPWDPMGALATFRNEPSFE